MSTQREGKIVDGRCHSLTASYIRDRHNMDDSVPICQYFEGFSMDGKESTMPYGVYTIDDLKEYGRDRNWCPYFLSRFAVCFYLNYHNFLIKLIIILDYVCEHRRVQLPLLIRSEDSRCRLERISQRVGGDLR